MNKLTQSLVASVLLITAPAAMAERVYVKSRGEVELAPFRCESFSRSTNVKRICYDEREKYALASVKGIWYHYCNVPPTTVAAWKKSGSVGRYYNDNIRSNFECTTAPAYR